MLKVGDRAPDFALESDGGETVKLADYRGRWLVLYFYPKDSTPGCTTEAQDFTAAKRKFTARGADVVGISKDSVASHCRFRDKFSLTVRLLSDPDLSAHEAFGAYGKKVMYGKEVMGTLRSTFLIGPDGVVAAVFPKVKVAGHVDAVLAALDEARGR